MRTYPKVAVRHALSTFFDVIDSRQAMRRTDLERLNAERKAAAWELMKAIVVAKRNNRDFMKDWRTIPACARWTTHSQPFRISEVEAWQMWLDAQRVVGGAA
ncbi:hypothetical protein H0P07_21840 [Escherichia coli]|uniref:hypothetical protein n=1 Tax=Escherichia coli TaxID=562 RepID=UPI0015D838B7|nr:hypothetical protein [Escherichia coli]NZB97771.1 hypothetical protein [Escherichia coli]